jgi:hypothetical protein
MKWMLLSFWAGVAGLGYVVACNGGVETTENPPPQSDSGASEGGSSDEIDASSGDDDSSSRVGCYTITGSGSTQECMYSSISASDAGCASTPGSTFGSCPPSDLFGCCVTAVDGGEGVTAVCYYAAGDASATFEESCEFASYDNPLVQENWQTFAP